MSPLLIKISKDFATTWTTSFGSGDFGGGDVLS